jgi:hypothetical protein
MENLIHHYLRILDIDPFGYFIRLINISHSQSIDLSNIYIRQFETSNSIEEYLTLTSYTFKDQLRPLLRSREIVTIYSKSYDQLKFDIEPYIFIAQDIRQWLTDNHIQTEISLNKIVFNSYRLNSFTSTDIPLLFINRTIHLNQLSTKTILHSNQYAKFIFPYCLSDNNIVNPHTLARYDENENKLEKNTCYKNHQIVKHFDSYPRRLTTTPNRIQSAKKIYIP